MVVFYLRNVEKTQIKTVQIQFFNVRSKCKINNSKGGIEMALANKNMENIINDNGGKFPTHSHCYETLYIGTRGEIWCGECATKLIDDDFYTIEQIYIHWEGDTMNCDKCQCELQPIYGSQE